MSIPILLKGILLGLGAAAPIGPVNVEIARRCLRGGFPAGFSLGLGAVTIDVGYAILTTFGLRPLVGRPAILTALGLAGSALLIYLGILCLISARRQIIRRRASDLPEQAPPAAEPPRRNYLTGLAITALNPMTLVFWFIAVPGIAGGISSRPQLELPFISAGVFVGALAWVIFFASLMTLLGRWSRTTLMLLADLAGGLLLIGFAAAAIWRIWRGFL